jgi:hypothetical protein
MVMRALVIGLVACACACQGGSSGTEGGGSGTASAARPERDAGGFGVLPPADAAPVAPPEDARVKPDEPEPPDPGKVIAELNAIPAWQAVVDRAQLLARRNQRGVVYGRVGPAIMVPGPAPEPTDAGVQIDAGAVASPYVWLVDDTDGNGTLGIRVKLDGRAAKEGDRVALGGAWDLDAERHWYWKVDAVQPLAPATPSDIKDPIAPVPTHVIANGDLPSGARTISVAKDNDAVYFQIVGPPPASEGDGWQVADQLGNPPFALMNLPGERGSYGGQDMRSPDERWQLKRGQTYWVRIGKIRKRAIDKPALVNARTAPVRVM